MSEELEKLRLECERAWSEVDEVARERDLLRAELAQRGEPVASLMTNIQSGDVELVWNDDGFDRALWAETPLYTAPPQRQPLADQVILDLADTHLYNGGKNYDVLAFGRSIEREHGIE